MKNKLSKRVMAGSMAAVLAAVGAGTYGFEQKSMSEVKAEEEDTETLKEAAETVLGDTTTESNGETYKDESVYVNADASGKVKKTTVTEWLKNTEKGSVDDETVLEDVENVKGNEKYKEGSDDSIVWESKGKDIYYQGTTDEELPVNMSITYKLDGKEISPKDLTGKSGKLEMTINYENKSKQNVDVDGQQTEMYTPFTLATAMMLPTDEYTNVTIDNGKIVSDGDKNIVVGVAFPGLSEDLGLDSSNLDVDIPSSVTITADVTDVSVGATYTMASANLLDSIGLDDVDSFDDLDDSINKLEDATNQLVDGSKELAEGTNTLNGKSGELISGVDKLADGVTAYTDGVAGVADGANAINSNMALVKNGVSAAVEGTGKLATGVSGVQSGLNTVASGINTAIANLNQSSENIKGLANQTALTDEEKQQIVSKVSAGLDQAGLSEEQKAAVDSAIASAVSAASDETNTKVAYAANEYSEGMSGAASQLSAASSALTMVDPSNPTATVAGGVAAVSAGIDELQTKLGTGTADQPGLTTGVEALASGVSQLADGANELNQKSSTLNSGMSTLKNGGEQLVSGVGVLASGADTLASGIAEYKSEAIDKLADAFGGDISKVTSRIAAMKELSANYKSYAGIKDGMNGSTKFIIETEAVSK
jgi:putative membrane protein